MRKIKPGEKMLYFGLYLEGKRPASEDGRGKYG
jgi:hypothetical protein